MNRVTIQNLQNPPYEVDEAINRLHVNLSFCGSEYKRIMITSSTPDEGKSVVSMQLWKKLADAGNRVVYVDADIRKSVLRSRHKLKTENADPKGLAHYLSGQAEVNDIVYETNIQNAYIVPVIRNIANPALLFHNEKFGILMQALANAFDYVIVDTPPLNAVADGELISAQCDGAILVVRGGVTQKSLIASSIKQLQKSSCKLLGAVLNRVEMGKGQYYYKYQKYGYYGNYYYSDKDGNEKSKN